MSSEATREPEIRGQSARLLSAIEGAEKAVEDLTAALELILAPAIEAGKPTEPPAPMLSQMGADLSRLTKRVTELAERIRGLRARLEI